MDNNTTHNSMANALRFLAADMVERAKSGHPGLPMGMADVVTVLFRHFIHINPAAPAWHNRDRFVLSAGHGSALLYALAHLLGYKAATLDELKRFRQLHSRTPGHPEHDLEMMVETTTGPLGQGFANAVGMALAERITKGNHHTYVIASDGDLMEGINHEAAALAAHLKLQKLIVLFDDNKITIDGATSLSSSEDVAARYMAYGWATRRVNGHNENDIHSALTWAHTQEQPVLLLCQTTIGYGAPTKAGTHHVHGSPLGESELAATRTALDWQYAPFEIPAAIKQAWEECATLGICTDPTSPLAGEEAKTLACASKSLVFAGEGGSKLLSSPLPSPLPQGEREPFREALTTIKQKFAVDKPNQATRVSSGQVLEALLPVLPALIGGSADLTPSNNTQIKNSAAITAPAYEGRYIHYGIREFAMAAMMNGMALHGTILPYGGTFLVFSDYMRNAIRMAALMRQRVIFVFTHDSIGLGEDGPTHQPVEHLAALRAIPHLRVLRPADAMETAEAWEAALHYQGPTALCLTRQNVPALRHHHDTGNHVERGGYVLREEAGAVFTLLATGSEVSLAIAVAEKLYHAGKHANVVSVPCVELLLQQPREYIDRIMPAHTIPVAIEAGIKMGWERLIGTEGLFFGVNDFGASAPAPDVYAHFGLTADAITAALMKAA